MRIEICLLFAVAGCSKPQPANVPSNLEAPAATPDAVKPAAGPSLDELMNEANRAYDKLDFDEARSFARKVLAREPTNRRMLRLMTSSHCIEDNEVEAKKYFEPLDDTDREEMKTRCARYGVTLGN